MKKSFIKLILLSSTTIFLNYAFGSQNANQCMSDDVQQLITFHEKMRLIHQGEEEAIGRTIEPQNDEYTIAHLPSMEKKLKDLCDQSNHHFYISLIDNDIELELYSTQNNWANAEIKKSLNVLNEVILQKKRFDFPAPAGMKYAFNFCTNEYVLIKELHFIGYTEDNDCVERDETYLPGGINWVPDLDD